MLWQDGDLDIVRAMVVRTQVDLEVRNDNSSTPLLGAAQIDRSLTLDPKSERKPSSRVVVASLAIVVD
jgi:hypothetical protein